MLLMNDLKKLFTAWEYLHFFLPSFRFLFLFLSFFFLIYFFYDVFFFIQIISYFHFCFTSFVQWYPPSLTLTHSAEQPSPLTGSHTDKHKVTSNF